MISHAKDIRYELTFRIKLFYTNKIFLWKFRGPINRSLTLKYDKYIFINIL